MEIAVKNKFQKKTNLLFYAILGAGFVVLVSIGILIANIYPKLLIIWTFFSEKLEALCGCTNHFVFSSHPFIFSLLILSGLGLAIFFGFVTFQILRLKRGTHKFIKANLRKRQPNISLKLEKIVKILGLENLIVQIDSEHLVVFCFGFMRPKICISSELVNILSNEELTAVLLHEQHHLFVYEPLKLFVVEIITKTLFFVPGTKALSKQYSMFSELAADQRATDGCQNKVHLAQAMYKILKWEECLAVKNKLAVSFFSPFDERINKLADDNYVPSQKIFSAKLFASVLFLSVSIGSFGALINSSELTNQDHAVDSCLLIQSGESNQCQAQLNGSDCSMSYNSDVAMC